MSNIIFVSPPIKGNSYDDVYRKASIQYTEIMGVMVPSSEDIWPRNGTPEQIAYSALRLFLEGKNPDLTEISFDQGVSLDTYLTTITLKVCKLHSHSKKDVRDDEFISAVRKLMKDVRFSALNAARRFTQ